MIFLIIWKGGIFFPKNLIFFLWARNERWPCSRNTWKYYIFCVYVRVLETWCHTRLPKKNQRWSDPTKIHLIKVITVLDWHPRKTSNNSLYFHGDLYRRFHVLLSSKKITGNLIYSIEIWLLLRFIRLEIFYNK